MPAADGRPPGARSVGGGPPPARPGGMRPRPAGRAAGPRRNRSRISGSGWSLSRAREIGRNGCSAARMRSAEEVSRRPPPNRPAPPSRAGPAAARSSGRAGGCAGEGRGAAGDRPVTPGWRGSPGERMGPSPAGRSRLGRSSRGAAGERAGGLAAGGRGGEVGAAPPGAAGRDGDWGCAGGAGGGAPRTAAGRSGMGCAAGACSRTDGARATGDGPGSGAVDGAASPAGFGLAATEGLRLSTTVRRAFLTTTIRRRSVSERTPSGRPLSGRATAWGAFGGSGLRFIRVALGLRFSSESCCSGDRSGVAVGLSSLILSYSKSCAGGLRYSSAVTTPRTRNQKTSIRQATRFCQSTSGTSIG